MNVNPPQLWPVFCLFRCTGEADEGAHPAAGAGARLAAEKTTLCRPSSCAEGGGLAVIYRTIGELTEREKPRQIPPRERRDMYPQGRHPVSSCLCHHL